MQALCYLKPDITLTGRLGAALSTLARNRFVADHYLIFGMNDVWYDQLYARAFDFERDSWNVNREFAFAGPWIALRLRASEGSLEVHHRLKSNQGSAVQDAGAPADNLRRQLGYGNRLHNCIHVPDTLADVQFELDSLFERAIPPIDCSPQQVCDVFDSHSYAARVRDAGEFQRTLIRRIVHRIIRLHAGERYTNETEFCGAVGSDQRTFRDLLAAIDMGESTVDALTTLCYGDLSNVKHKLFNVQFAIHVLGQLGVFLTTWDRSCMYGHFCYPTI